MKQFTLTLLTLLPTLLLAQAVQLPLLGQWQDTTLVGSRMFDNTYNEVWGIARGGKEYAIIGSTEGTHFIDVTNPAEASEVFFVEGGTSGEAIIHRDYHDYGCYLYAVADEGSNSTLQIIDLSDLPNSIEVVYDSKELIRRAHNIFIDSSAARLYAMATMDGANWYEAIKIYDLSNPANPVLMAEYSSFQSVSVSHVH
ncbi:MAG: hypothetical protein AAFO94_20810, partial [Bacteroidota bacterium]